LVTSAFLFLLATSALSCDVPAGVRQKQMSLPYVEFDGAPAPHGWRTLNSAGCTDAAIALLNAYAESNAARLLPEDALEIWFHIGQALAFAGRDQAAIPYMEKADRADAPEEWRAFVAAHLAFLRHDRAALEAARRRYAKAAPNSMRLKFILGFLACPDKTYMEAAHCAM